MIQEIFAAELYSILTRIPCCGEQHIVCVTVYSMDSDVTDLTNQLLRFQNVLETEPNNTLCRVGKSRLTVVCIENNTTINK